MSDWLTLWCLFNTAAIIWVAIFRVRKIVIHSGGSNITKIDKHVFKTRSKAKK